MVGGAISGYSSMGRLDILIIPRTTIIIEITVESTGLSINVFKITRYVYSLLVFK
ncbi:hypothetical protein PI23P_03827 [Polaribacter irgensii 23-P]|uniref:Uncharacterized protein n=1 Tax=Polaribacter irgensii 23-P TaxID=313594 RepID=A4BXA2_9FLAO|nr:hypothetical protein PI23P_03827 [Polaribacter irgensii 23-P]